MPVFEIQQYELHTQKYRVTAATEAEAIAMLLNGEADAEDGGLEYVEIADDFGMSVDENQDLAVELAKLDVVVGEAVIPSICSIEQVE